MDDEPNPDGPPHPPGHWVRGTAADVMRFSGVDPLRKGYMEEQARDGRLAFERISAKMSSIHFTDDREHEAFRSYLESKARIMPRRRKKG
jgi:hypothetical protein